MQKERQSIYLSAAKLKAGEKHPVVIVFEDHRFRSLCGGHYLSLLRREKKNAHKAFVFVKNEEYSYYLNNFGKQFQR